MNNDFHSAQDWEQKQSWWWVSSWFQQSVTDSAFNPQMPASLLPDEVYKHITISRASFEQKRGKSVRVIENKWSAYGKTILSRIHS